MNNSIVVSVRFSFKGENFDLSAPLDLDAMLTRGEQAVDLHHLLARHNDVDTYSYLYEVMEATPLTFSAATGFANTFVTDGEFDLAAFTRHWQEQQILATLARIAREEMGVDDLASAAPLRSALLAAYLAGQLAQND